MSGGVNMDIFNLKNKTALITGGNRGIGKALAISLAKAGADIVIVGRDEEKNKQVINDIEKIGSRGVGFSADLRNTRSINNLLENVVESVGSIDILINNAGVSNTNFAFDVSEEEWDTVMDLNVKSLFFCCQATAKKMKQQGYGKIINIASITGEVGEKGISPYTASKAAVINLTRSLALEWARFGIQVNAIGPGYIETDMNREELSNPKVRDKIVSKTPLGRLGTSEELGGAAILLASDAGSFITGQTLFVDGGWLAQ